MKSGQEDGYDAVYLSAHKFLGGPCSPGILLLNKKLYKLGLSPPSTCGGGTIDFVNGIAEKASISLLDIILYPFNKCIIENYWILLNI
jgi:hypothetical protein